VYGASPLKIDFMFVDRPFDAVIVGLTRTPLMRVKKRPSPPAPPGGRKPRPSFYKNHTADLLEHVIFSLFTGDDDTKSIMGDVQDVVVGNCNSSTMQVSARIAQARAFQRAGSKRGINKNIPANYAPGVKHINRQCSSGLQAFLDTCHAVNAGHINCGISAGVEAMSSDRLDKVGVPSGLDARREMATAKQGVNPVFAEMSTPMGITSENVARQYFVSRRECDNFAVESHRRAAIAKAKGVFNKEISPLDDEYFKARGIPFVTGDDGIREGTSIDTLGGLRPSFKKGGVTTAGNSSQLTDGAAGAVVTSRSFAASKNLPILGVLRGSAVVGLQPKIMGIGPIYAIPKALENANIRIEDVDLFEINEAFATQAIVCIKELKLPPNKVNVNGGAIALGHPLGCTGMRQIVSLVNELRRRGGGIGVVSMCVGTGMGAAAIIEVPKSAAYEDNNIGTSKL